MVLRVSDIRRFLYFLLAVCIGNDIFYFIHTGNTYLNISLLISVVLLILDMQCDGRAFIKALKRTHKSIKVYFFFILMSCFVAVINFGGSGLRSFVMGLIDLFLSFTVFLNVMMMDEKFGESFYKGLYIGFVANIFMSLIQYLLYKSGNSFSWYNYFPNSAFQRNIYWYRAQGFFLETSHFLSYLSCVIPIVLISMKKSQKNILLFLCSILILGYLLLAVGLPAGSTVLLLFSLVFSIGAYFWSFEKKVSASRKSILSVLFIIGLLIVVAIVALERIDFAKVSRILSSSLQTASLSDADNAIRSSCMMGCLRAAVKNPLGIGYNTTALYINNFLSLKVSTAFNFTIQMFLELGYLGGVSYLVMIGCLCFRNLKDGIKYHNKRKLVVFVAVMMAFLCQFSLGRIYFPYISMVYALGNAELFSPCNIGQHWSLNE